MVVLYLLSLLGSLKQCHGRELGGRVTAHECLCHCRGEARPSSSEVPVTAKALVLLHTAWNCLNLTHFSFVLFVWSKHSTLQVSMPFYMALDSLHLLAPTGGQKGKPWLQALRFKSRHVVALTHRRRRPRYQPSPDPQQLSQEHYTNWAPILSFPNSEHFLDKTHIKQNRMLIKERRFFMTSLVWVMENQEVISNRTGMFILAAELFP